MKLLSAVIILLIGSVNAFAPPQHTFETSSSALFADQQSSRSKFLSNAAAVWITGSVVWLQQSEPVHAAKYGSFGTGSPSVLNPTDADIDATVLASSTVQAALRKVQGYKDAVNTMQSALEKDSQTNVRSIIGKELDFSTLRESLNTVNAAFEEDTQRGTDRLIRVIMQDITELETANNQKDGIERSPRRVEFMKGKLAKLEKAFDDYLAFAK